MRGNLGRHIVGHDVILQFLDPGLDLACPGIPLVGRQAAQFGHPVAQVDPFPAELPLLVGHLPRVFPLGLAQACPGRLPQPAGIGRLLQIAIMDRHGQNVPIAGQHGAVAGENAAARAGQADRPPQRPRGRLAEGGPLAHFKLHRAAEDDCQQCRQPESG